LAVIALNNLYRFVIGMIMKGTPYIKPEGYLFLDHKRKLGLVKRIQKQLDKFALTKEDFIFSTN